MKDSSTLLLSNDAKVRGGFLGIAVLMGTLMTVIGLWQLSVGHGVDAQISNLILFVGALISFLLGLMVYFAISLRVQSIALKEQRNFLDRVIDSSPLGILVLDKQRNLTLWTPACEEMFGWTEDEALGNVLPFVPEEYRDESNAFIDRIIQSGEKNETDAVRRRKDGTEIIVRISGMALQNKKEVYGMMAIMDDVTETKIAQREILKAQQIAEKAAASKTEFLANMSHEIRTPLNGIIGMSDLLLDTEMGSEQKRYANIIQNAATTLLTLINDILDFSKLEAGKVQLESLDFSLTGEVESEIEVLVSKAYEKNLSLVTFISPDLPRTVRGDPGRISQVLLNLVGNAIKFTESGGVSLTVTASGDFIRFEVKDTGIGLSEGAKEKLFKPFSQVDGSTARKYGGTGLGLSICRNLVKAMGGTIGIESEEGKGSTFWFELPLPAVTPPVSAETLEVERNKKILVIDHDPICLGVIKKYLSSWRMEGDCISDPMIAINLIRTALASESAYDVILVSSIELGKEIKKRFQEQCPRLVLMLDFHKNLEDAIDKTFAESINKPIKQSQLNDSIVRGDLPTTEMTIPSVQAVERHSKEERILVADDVPANQLLTIKFLEKLGYHAQAVGNGKEVLAELEKIYFDLILMDCQMPEMDGYETTRMIRQMKDPKFNSIPIIALTANALEGDAQKCYDAGMNDYISKPFKRESLGEIIERWLVVSSSKSKS